MNAVVFYSNTGQCKNIASYFSNNLGYTLIDIETDIKTNCTYYENLVLVFPVHCQNIPDIVKTFLEKVTVKYLTAVATYGKMCCGNVLYEIQNRYQKNIVAGAYIPTKHSYIEDDDIFNDFDKLNIIVEKIKSPSYIKLSKLYKNPLADILPKQRSRAGLIIQKNTNCNECNFCSEHCSFDAIKMGKINNRCIRCLKCVDICPRKALKIKMKLPLKIYLSKKRMTKLVIYI